MKKIIFALFCILLLCSLVLCVAAEDAATGSVEDGQNEEEVTAEESTTSEGNVSDVEGKIDYSEIAGQFFAYIQSGEAPEELLDAMILMGEQMQEMKEEGYTLKDRLLQLLSKENILTIASAAFMLIGGIFWFILRCKLKNIGYDSEDSLKFVKELNEAFSKEKEARENAEKKNEEYAAAMRRIEEKINSLDQSTQRAAKGALAVASMTKDVFLNSRTIDAEGKNLLTHNYVEAVGLLKGANDEQQSEV